MIRKFLHRADLSSARFWIPAALFAFAVGSLPTLYALGQQDGQHVFRGYLHYPEDMESYAMWMRQAANGAWLFVNPYEFADHPAVYFNSLWLFCGKLMGIFGLSFGTMLQLLRLGGSFVLAAGFFRLTRVLFPDTDNRPLLGLFLLGSGFGWLFRVLETPLVSPDVYTELYPFVQTALVPHAALAHGLLLFALEAAVRSERTGDLRPALCSGLLLFLLGTFRAYEPAVGLAVLGAWFAVRFSFRSEHRAAVAKRALVCLIPPLIPLVYTGWLTRFSTGFSVWSRTNVYPPPDVLSMALALGVLLPAGIVFALQTFVLSVRRPDSARPPDSRGFPTLWLIVATLLMFGGFLPFAWRTCAPFTTPFFLALGGLVNRIPKRFHRKIVWSLLFLALLPGSVWILNHKMQRARIQDPLWFEPPELTQTLDWAAKNAAGSRVWSHGNVSLKLAAAADVKVLLGHKDLTADFVEKRAEYGRFLGLRNPGEAARIPADYGADLLLWGPLEDRRARFHPDRLPGWTPIFKNGPYRIYRLTAASHRHEPR